MLDLRFTAPFFARGAFPATVQNASATVALADPWLGRGPAAPFDQRAPPAPPPAPPTADRAPAAFFLVLDVAVGGYVPRPRARTR